MKKAREGATKAADMKEGNFDCHHKFGNQE